MANMMMNGFVSPPPGSSYTLGKPATVFIRLPGKYRLVIPETDVHIGISTGPVVTVSADPIYVTVVPPNEAFISRTLSEIEHDMGSSDVMTRGWATERLRNLPNVQAVPLLVNALEDDYKNVLEPAIHGLLEYPDPKIVAREIHRAIDAGRPTRPAAMRWYADVLARTEYGWPSDDARSAQRVDAESERWRLLLEYRQKQVLAKRSLTPEETVKAFEDGLIQPSPKACETAFQQVLAHSGNREQLGAETAVIDKCGSAQFIPELWKLARAPGIDKQYVYAKLLELGQQEVLADALADMASDKPRMGPFSNEVYLAALKERPADAAKIIDKKLLSGNHEQADFAWRLLTSVTTPMPAPYLPLDWARIRSFLLAAKPLDENVCMGVADYFAWYAPKEARDLAQGVLDQLKQQGKPLNSSVARIFALLPASLGSPFVRAALQAKNPVEAAAMAEGLSMATTTLQFASNQPQSLANPTLIGYFPDLLAYFEKSSDPNGRRSAALAMKSISGLPEFPPYTIDPVSERRWISAWEDWARQHKPKK